MNDNLDASYFTDADDLTKLLEDERASDTQTLSTVADAVEVINQFRSSTASGPWGSLDRAEVADRLTAILGNPRLIQQGDLNLCGPAAFFNIVASRDPVSVAQCATSLFDTGSGAIGSLKIEPGSDLISTDYSAMRSRMKNSVTPQADWMLLGALRNSTDVFWQGSFTGDPGQTVSAMTTPEALAGWLKDTGIFASVEDHGKWATNPGIPNAENLHLGSASPGTDIAVLINANIINSAQGRALDTTFILSSFPNHWVILVSEITPAATNQLVFFPVWSWGSVLTSTYQGKTINALVVPQQVFVDNYYGVIISRLSQDS
jgi:hypothetical protein